MNTLEYANKASLAQLLAQREAELREQLAPDEPEETDGGHEVRDFKDIAVEDLRAWVEEAQASQALGELLQILAARRRMHEGTYGQCLDCGDAIDPRRLRAMPMAAYCTSCSDYHEGRRH